MLRAVLFILWAGMIFITLYMFYGVYLGLNRSAGPDIKLTIFAAAYGIMLVLICYKSYMTLSTGKITEKYAEDPKMGGFKFVLLLLGIPALLVPGIMLYFSYQEYSEGPTISSHSLGRDSAYNLGWQVEPEMVLFFVGGIILVSFAFLYPTYIKRLAQSARH